MIVKPIATHVITGFLGVGKTSLIKYLLTQKPENEVWAILVNEFGEIGIDGQLLQNSDSGVAIKEVAGGCLCCAAGVPTQVAVNQLIAKAKPDRLFIEPTGLGHPTAIIQVLSQAQFAQVLSLRSTICLVDPRKLDDVRYRQHETFRQQLQIADLVIATKMDLASSSQLQSVKSLLAELDSEAPLLDVSLQQVPRVGEQSLYEHLLQHFFMAQAQWPRRQATQVSAATLLAPPVSLFDRMGQQQDWQFDEQGLHRDNNQHEGFYSAGWVFDCDYEFDFEACVGWINDQECLRLKAVLITSEGIAALNYVDGKLDVIERDDCLDSRIELITSTPIDMTRIENQLRRLSKRLSI